MDDSLADLSETVNGQSEPMSPASSGDATFEPTIEDEMNGFDDETTLETEEAQENKVEIQNEVDALKEESEMPLEELLAKYQALPPLPHLSEPPKKKAKKTPSAAKKQKLKENGSGKDDVSAEMDCSIKQTNSQAADVILIESGDDAEPQTTETEKSAANGGNIRENTEASMSTQEKPKVRRSHLFELYPEQFNTVQGSAIALEALYSDEDEDDDLEEQEEHETDPDYVKKRIMVGSAFQASIPDDGLSQYGDILPYENEDKLVWEPSQVSETEVEDYLLKVREIKPTLAGDDTVSGNVSDRNETSAGDNQSTKNAKEPVICQQNDKLKKSQHDATENKSNTNIDSELGAVVKDNEQALHLLVQCGYDFKEALRRKRLNAVPLTGDTMSLWSEEECQKFEEGIQKYGKDFLKIRQHQVRTRTMRELVQFYYLWKKSERRDHNFANSDTVDHMDIYLNEGEDYNSNTNTNVPATTSTAAAPGRKLNGALQNNFSIMTGGSQSSSPSKVGSSNRKRTLSDTNNCSSNTKSSAGGDHSPAVPLQANTASCHVSK